MQVGLSYSTDQDEFERQSVKFSLCSSRFAKDRRCGADLQLLSRKTESN